MTGPTRTSLETGNKTRTNSEFQKPKSIYCKTSYSQLFKSLTIILALTVLILGSGSTVFAAPWGGTAPAPEPDQLYPFANQPLFPQTVKNRPPKEDTDGALVSPPHSLFSSAPAQPAETAPSIETVAQPETAPAVEVEVPAAPATQSDIEHVVIISVDGMRPDAMEAAITPNLDKLRARGVYNPHGQTVKNSITLISHASMLTGMVPEKHGIMWGLPYIGWPGMNGPTLFTEAHAAGLTTGMVFGKEKLNYINIENSVDDLYGVNTHDLEVKEHAVDFINQGMPNAFFIHFPDNDRVGHAFGWMSQNQLYAIGYVDGLIGEVLAAIDANGYTDSTLVIVTADHGGHGKGHGDDSPLDRTIPWIAAGPGVQQGVILDGELNTEDTAATALYALGLPIPEYWDGIPQTTIFK